MRTPGTALSALEQLARQSGLIAPDGAHRRQQAWPAEAVSLARQARRAALRDTDLLQVAQRATKARQQLMRLGPGLEPARDGVTGRTRMVVRQGLERSRRPHSTPR